MSGHWQAIPCDPCLVIGDFSTERLAVRPMASDDLEYLAGLNSDTEVMRFITGRPTSKDETALEIEAALGTRWLVFARDGGEFLGWVGAVPMRTGNESEVGWRFRRSAWGHGYAAEASRVLIDQLFVNGARRVFAQTMATNERSRAVMERLGLRYCRTFHLYVDDPLPGTELGEVEWELTRSDWERRQP